MVQIGQELVKMKDEITHFYRNINLCLSEANQTLQQLYKRYDNKIIREMVDEEKTYDLKEIQLPYKSNDILLKNYIKEIEMKRGKAMKITINMKATFRHITTRPFQLKLLLQKIVARGDFGHGQEESMKQV